MERTNSIRSALLVEVYNEVSEKKKNPNGTKINSKKLIDFMNEQEALIVRLADQFFLSPGYSHGCGFTSTEENIKNKHIESPLKYCRNFEVNDDCVMQKSFENFDFKSTGESFKGIKSKIAISKKKIQYFNINILKLNEENLSKEDVISFRNVKIEKDEMLDNALSQKGFFYLQNKLAVFMNKKSLSSLSLHFKETINSIKSQSLKMPIKAQTLNEFMTSRLERTSDKDLETVSKSSSMSFSSNGGLTPINVKIINEEEEEKFEKLENSKRKNTLNHFSSSD